MTMRDVFLDSLVQDLKPVRRLNPAIGWLLLAGGIALSALLVVGGLKVRPDFGAVWMTPPFLWKILMFTGLGAGCGFAAIQLARPAAPLPRHRRWGLALWALLLVGPVAISLAASGQAPVAARLDVSKAVSCFSCIVMASLAPLAALTWWMRQGAPVQPRRAALLIGLASGALGAAVFALHCPHNDLLYVGLWYTLSVAFIALVARLLLPRLLKW